MKRFMTLTLLILLLFANNLISQVVVVSGSHASSDGNYMKLSLAFAAINAVSQDGKSILITINASYTENTSGAILSSGNWSNLKIIPSGNIIITGTTVGNGVSSIRFDGADNVTIDGLNDGSNSLTISNAYNTNGPGGAPVLLFINDASNNTIKNCTIKGSSYNTSSGVIFFSTGSVSGNDNNIIENCEITTSGTRQLISLYSEGSASKENSGNIIRNNKFYNFFKKGQNHSYGISIGANSTNFTITGNSFYETDNPFKHNVGKFDLIAIYVNNPSGDNFNITNNFIGGNSSECGGTWNFANVNVSNFFYGIKLNVGSTSASIVENNTIKNISLKNDRDTNFYGIYVTAGAVNIGSTIGNTISNINLNSKNGKFYGIYNLSNNATIAKNTIKDISTTVTSSSTNLIGLYNKGNASVYNNNINNFTATTGGTDTIKGIEIEGGTSTYYNNMIALGNGLSNSFLIYGIDEISGINNVYFNSIYIGGTSVDGSKNTFALKSAVTTNVRNFKNNIFYNARSNGAGTGKHYAIAYGGTTPNPTGLSSDYNIYYTNGTGGTLAFYNSSDVTTLQALRYYVGQDLHSAFANPNFIDASASTPNLHLNPTNPAESSGISIPSITIDFDGDTRSNDIGADANNFTFDDTFTPNISYTTLTNGPIACGGTSSRTFTATITDLGTGVPLIGNVPRVWYNKNGGSWFSSAGTLSSGDGNNGVWSFTIDYTLLGGIINNDVIRYYIVAQDQAATPNIWYTAFEANSPLHTDINTQTTPPTSPNNYTIVPDLSGTMTVGSGGDYSSLTGAGGLFEAINNDVVTGNITVNIISDITETGTFALNQWIESCGSGHTLTIQPDGTTVRTISASSLSTPLIKINGADGVTINGINKYLVFAHNGSSPAIEIADGSKNITINQCDLSANTAGESGVINITLHSVANNGPSVTITNNNIHTYTFTAPSANAQNLIFINNNYIGPTNISNNNLYNFRTSAIYINAHGTRKYTISENHIYNLASNSTGSYYGGMNLLSGDSIEVTNNYIGGQASNCGGSAWLNAAVSDFYGIRISNSISSTMKFCEVKNNTIKNITQSNNSNFAGIQIDLTYVLSTLVEGNTINSISTTYTSSPKYLRGIHIVKGANVRKNKIYDLNGMTSTSNNWIMGIDFDNTSVDVNNDISNNMICLDGGSRDHNIYGIRSNTRTSSTLNTFYNSVYIKGTITSSASNNTAAFYRNIASFEYCRNNIFINTRTGTTNNYAIRTNSSSLANHTSNYNFLVAPAASQIAYDGSARNFATWVSSGKDVSSWCAIATTGSTDYSNINLSDLFIDASNCNLNVNNNNAASWFVFGKGIAGASSNNIATDFTGNTRSTTYGMATCIGAHQFSQPTVDPISANQSGTLSAGNTTTYSFGNRTICSIDWAAASNVPTSIDIKYFSGVNPPNPYPVTAKYNNYYVLATATGGSSPFNYTMNLNYDDAFQGTFNTLADARLAKYDGTSWLTYKATSNLTGASNPYTISVNNLTSFSAFTGADFNNPLPIELINFEGKCYTNNTLLSWSTASETNNDYFTIEKSTDNLNWVKIGTIKGKGNNTNTTHYQFIDKNNYELNVLYKLTQTDFNGNSVSYEPINLFCNLNSNTQADFNIYPNPFKSKLIISINANENNNINLCLYNYYGIKIFEQNYLLNNEKIFIKEFDFSLLPKGIYLLKITGENFNESTKIIKE